MADDNTIQHCDAALSYLHQAEKYLSKAGRWGLVDMFGGKTFSTYLKRSNFDKARENILRASSEIRIISESNLDKKVKKLEKQDIGLLLSFADYFADGFFADFLVQRKISKAKAAVSDAIKTLKKFRSKIS